MESILERYERYSLMEKRQNTPETESSTLSWTLEHAKLKARLEVLHRSQKHFMGENLESMSLKELQNLEQQIDSALKHIRTRKNQLMYESISELQKKDKALQEQNNLLAKKVKEKEKAIAQQQQAQWKQQDSSINSSSAPPPQPMQQLSNTRNNQQEVMDNRGGEQVGVSTHDHIPVIASSNAIFPSWMINSHVRPKAQSNKQKKINNTAIRRRVTASGQREGHDWERTVGEDSCKSRLLGKGGARLGRGSSGLLDGWAEMGAIETAGRAAVDCGWEEDARLLIAAVDCGERRGRGGASCQWGRVVGQRTQLGRGSGWADERRVRLIVLGQGMDMG
ncbi:hypothetical protein ACFE04_010663 [Oxalis oulophora]